MDAATDNGANELKVAREFNSLFPEAHNFINYYTGTKGEPTWNSKVGLHGRYVLTVKFYIKFDESRLHPTRTNDAKFYLVELQDITANSIGYSSRQIRFGLAEWERLVKSGGDFKVVGYPMIMDEPLSGFNEAWKSS